MPWSDDDDFESADEGSHVSLESKERKKRLSSSNFSESVNGSDHEHNKDTKPLPASVKPVESTPKFTQESSDGWDDFPIEDDVSAETKTTESTKIAKAKSKSSGNENKDTGWDDFGDWGDDKEETSNVKDKKPAEPSKADLKLVADRLSAASVKEDKSSSWGWGGWGVDSLLSTATAGISTITNHVSQGINTVLETGIGAPDPEELARNQQTKMQRSQETSEVKAELSEARSQDDGFQFGSLISGVTKFVETTGTKVLAGGLDTLETIGKKTMEVLQDGDPGLAKKRALLGLDAGEKVVLSQVLREAKSKADEEDRLREEKREAKEVHYETLFDDFEGLVHLEALEMLSRQVRMRIDERLRAAEPDKRLELKETLQQVAELCEMPEEDDESSEETTGDLFHERLQEATQDLGLKMQFQPLVKQFTDVLEWLSNDDATEKAIYKHAVSSLAQYTAMSVEIYHKTAEMLLVKPRRSTADEADALTQMTTVLTKHIGELAAKFTAKLNLIATENKEQINNYTTNIFLEAGNSSTYIQNAFQLALPILQIGAV